MPENEGALVCSAFAGADLWNESIDSTFRTERVLQEHDAGSRNIDRSPGHTPRNLWWGLLVFYCIEPLGCEFRCSFGWQRSTRVPHFGSLLRHSLLASHWVAMHR